MCQDVQHTISVMGRSDKISVLPEQLPGEGPPPSNPNPCDICTNILQARWLENKYLSTLNSELSDSELSDEPLRYNVIM